VAWEDGHQQIVVSRENVLRDSFARFSELKDNEFRQFFRFEFIGEDGIDAGGLAREWWEVVTDELFAIRNGLFMFSAGDNLTYQINPSSQYNVESHLQWYRFAGRFLAKALLDEQTIPAHLVRPLYKHLLALPVRFDDLEFVDRQLRENLEWLLDNDGVEALFLDFTIADDTPDGPKVIELRPGGAEDVVTDHNKLQYVALTFEHRMLNSVSPMLYHLLRGFYEVVPLGLISVFDFNEIELLMCGIEEIDVDDWREHTHYQGTFRPTSRIIRWFWDVVEELDHEQRTRLLQYATGTARVPVGGFRNLQGNDGAVRAFTLQSIAEDEYGAIRAHTCFNRLDIPPFESKEQLRVALTSTISLEVAGFSTE